MAIVREVYLIQQVATRKLWMAPKFPKFPWCGQGVERCLSRGTSSGGHATAGDLQSGFDGQCPFFEDPVQGLQIEDLVHGLQPVVVRDFGLTIFGLTICSEGRSENRPHKFPRLVGRGSRRQGGRGNQGDVVAGPYR